jgi:hypothetical protein
LVPGTLTLDLVRHKAAKGDCGLSLFWRLPELQLRPPTVVQPFTDDVQPGPVDV